MGSMRTINTNSINNSVKELEQHSAYFTKKKTTFSGYGNVPKLSSALAKIQTIYTDIAQNINNVSKYLKDYIKDVEGLENQMSSKGGTVSATQVNSIASKYKNTIKNYNIDSQKIFEINNVNNNTNKRHSENVDYALIEAAETSVSGLALLEGIVNVGEMILDGGAMLTAGACSIFGADDAANAIGNFVKKDLSKDLYHYVVDKTGLNQYADPDGIGANIASMTGNIVGMVSLSLLTGGAATAAFGTGATATTVTVAANATIGSLSNMGSEGERALNYGATLEEAEQSALIAGGVGLIQGAMSGKFDSAARIAGASLGNNSAGKIAQYALASFAVGSTEPLINEMAQTAIYRNDNQSGYWNNFISNSTQDGLLFQMALAGGINSIGTVGNGLAGINRYNTLSNMIDEAMTGNNTKIINIADTSEISPDLMRKITNEDKVVFKIGDQLFSVKNGSFESISSVNNNRINVNHIDDLDITEELPVIKPKEQVDLDITEEIPVINKDTATRMLSASEFEEEYLNIRENPISFYQNNMQHFMRKGMDINEYLAQIGVSAKSFFYTSQDALEAAIEFNDKTIFLVQKATELSEAPNIDYATKAFLNDIINSSTYDINDEGLQQFLLPYLNKTEIQALDQIGTRTFRNNLNTQQQNTLYQFTRAGGCNIDRYLRTGYLDPMKTKTDLLELEDLMNSKNQIITFDGKQIVDDTLLRSARRETTIIDDLVEIIEQNANKEPIIAVRRVDSLGGEMPIITKDNIDSFIGKTFTDKAFGSFSLMQGVDTAYSDLSIEMIATIDTGSGAMIQSCSGLYTQTEEFLVKPGYVTTIIDGYYDVNRDKIVLHTLVSAK